MPLNIIRADITKVKADAIVNTANPLVAIGAGVDRAIYEAAGAEQLLAERAKIGPMKPGQAAATPAFELDAKYIIHTIGPAWEGGKYGEYDAVASCYKESLKIADELHCESIAFPLISTGTLGFPKDKALKIAINEISSFLFEHDMKVYMVVYDKEAFVISGKAFAGVRTYIEERDVKPPAYSVNRRERRSRDLMYHRTEQSIGGHFPGAAVEDISLAEEVLETNKEVDGLIEDDEVFEMSMEPAAEYSMSQSIDLSDMSGKLEDILKSRGETFQQMLFRIIDRKHLKDSDVYHKANISRKLFSKIRSNEYYTPSKKTALAFAIALELNLDETLDLIGSAGYTLSDASVFDLIIKYCIIHKIYDIFEINNYLFKYTDQVLAV